MCRDRKRKKFVGESEKEALKKRRIKTESGQWIRASFKSNAYKEWKDKHKIEAPLVGCEEEGVAVGGQRSAATSRRQYGRGNSNNTKKKAGPPVARRPVGDLKSKAAILKKRQKKEAMERNKKRTRHQQQRTDRQRKSGRGFQSRVRRN